MDAVSSSAVKENRGGEDLRKKILYIQPGTFHFAGIERVVDTICNQLSERFVDDFSVDVLYTTLHKDRPSTPKYNIIDRRPKGRLGLMRAFREVVAGKKYDLIVVPQIEPAVIVMTACLGLKRNFAVHLHGNPHRERSHLKARILFFLMKKYFLPRVSSVFGTSPKQLDSFKAMFASRRPQYWVPNPVRDFGPLPEPQGRPRSEPVTFVNVGRFSHQKGQDILLEAFAEVMKHRSGVRLKLVGHGGNEAELRQQIRRLGLEEVVTIHHLPDNPLPALASSDIYVSSSRWEGWSLAICEALRFGLPVIATNCDFGPSDILVEPRLGRLVDAEGGASLVEAMIYYIDHLEAEKADASYRQAFIDQFSEAKVVSVHAEALKAAAGQRARRLQIGGVHA